MKRLRSRRGESIVETLISLAIIAIVFCLLAQAILTSAKINARAGGDDGAVRYDSEEYQGEFHIRVGRDIRRAALWKTGDGGIAGQGYYYYMDAAREEAEDEALK